LIKINKFCRKLSENCQNFFILFNNPKDKGDTERMIRTIKEKVFLINEFYTFEEV
jgi:hypothetical protein